MPEIKFKLLIEVETYSDEEDPISIDDIKRDVTDALEQELDLDVNSIEVTDITKAES